MEGKTNSYFDKIPSHERKKPCTGRRSVVVVFNQDQTAVLLEKRRYWPEGWSFVAEHIERRKSSKKTAYNGLFEETTLTLSDIKNFVFLGSIVTDDTCRRRGKSHWTAIYMCTSLTEDVKPHDDEVTKLRWVPLSELEKLVQRTKVFSQGKLSEKAFRRNPGLIPASEQVLQYLRHREIIRV